MSKLLNLRSLSWKVKGLIVAIIMFVLFGIFGAFKLLAFLNSPKGTPISLEKQGKGEESIRYNAPIIIDSSPYFIVPVTYGNSRELLSLKEGYNDGIINYVFLNKTKQESRKLFKTNVQILESNIGNGRVENHTGDVVDSRILIYRVVTTDTNGDKVLNDNDYSAVYVSELDGQNLRKISSDRMYVDYFTEDVTTQKILIGLHDKAQKQFILVYDYKTGKEILYGL